MSKKSAIPLLILLLILALAAGYLLGAGRHAGHEFAGPEGAKSTATEKTQYTCGMHPFIIQDEPGLCPICGMKLTPLKPGAGTSIATERKIRHWVSPMDPGYVREEPGKDHMGHDLVPVYEEPAGTGVFIDPVTAQNMGIRTASVELRDLARTLRAVGLVTYEESRQYSINSKIDGWIERLYVNQAGQMVRKGQPLLEIFSPELVAAQQEYILALDNSRRLSNSPFPEIVDGSRRLLEAARTRLAYWDISAAQIQELEQTRQLRKTLTLYSAYGGVVTEKKAFEGMRVMAGEELLQVSDLSRVWVNVDIYEYELPWVKVGQAAEVEIPFAVGTALPGKIAFIYPYLQNETRTIQARIELPNPNLELKPDMYANVRIKTQAMANALAIPENAVLKSGKKQTVFVARGEGRFEPRAVETGITDDAGFVQILSGLSEGEVIVVSAQFMLDSESKLREAIEKMLAPKVEEPSKATAQEVDLDELFK